MVCVLLVDCVVCCEFIPLFVAPPVAPVVRRLTRLRLRRHCLRRYRRLHPEQMPLSARRRSLRRPKRQSFGSYLPPSTVISSGAKPGPYVRRLKALRLKSSSSTSQPHVSLWSSAPSSTSRRMASPRQASWERSDHDIGGSCFSQTAKNEPF